MEEYMGIKLDKSVKLYKKDGNYNKQVKNGLDALAELLDKNGHVITSSYIGDKGKILIDFECGHNPHLISPNDYRNSNTRCPLCSTSKGVRIICEQFLDVNNIPYMTEYKFPIHANSRSGFRYDIIVPYDNLIIEVHGGQHYEDHYYHNKKRSRTLAEEQYNDCAKKELAESLGYNYIIVDYREHNPQLALERFMKQYSRIKTEVTI